MIMRHRNLQEVFRLDKVDKGIQWMNTSSNIESASSIGNTTDRNKIRQFTQKKIEYNLGSLNKLNATNGNSKFWCSIRIIFITKILF